MNNVLISISKQNCIVLLILKARRNAGKSLLITVICGCCQMRKKHPHAPGWRNISVSLLTSNESSWRPYLQTSPSKLAKVVVDLRGHPSAPKCSQFHAVFWKIWQNRMLGPLEGRCTSGDIMGHERGISTRMVHKGCP